LKARYDFTPRRHHLYCGDFFEWFPNEDRVPPPSRADYFARNWGFFDLIVGNPPFGGSIRADLHDSLDAVYGFRLGQKIKKETYSFFLVKSFDLLHPSKAFRFICSDTFLTINTMRGLRYLLMERGECEVTSLDSFSSETDHPMVVAHFRRTNRPSDRVVIDGRTLSRKDIERTQNLSWRVSGDFARFFTGVTLADYCVATSGMTIGNNDLFLREIKHGSIIEPYRFEFFQQPITLERELARARLGRISVAKQREIREQERRGRTQRNVRTVPLSKPYTIKLPHPDYLFYNKANNEILYAAPRWAIYWRDNGDAVLTFKKSGKWYLHGVGGQPYFMRSGLTWSLISPRLCMKFLPEGYILDSGAPCAFLREGVPEGELFFILGWSLTSTCNRILKNVINHTRNIQSKDFERLPYPSWVAPATKMKIIRHVKKLVREAMNGAVFNWEHPRISILETQFEIPPNSAIPSVSEPRGQYRHRQQELALSGP
jgi:hypothetical protein